LIHDNSYLVGGVDYSFRIYEMVKFVNKVVIGFEGRWCINQRVGAIRMLMAKSYAIL
jgi:hypothetical protein